MDDLISRQAAIDSLHMHLMYRMGTDSNKKRLDEWINNLPSAQPEQDIDELLTPDEIAELVKKQPIAYRDIYEDGYTKALRDFTDLARTDLYTPITFYDEGVNTGIRKEINLAEYLMQKIRGTENK